MAPVIMGNPDRPELGEELTNSFCRTDPRIARVFARATFLSDNRADLARVTVPTLVLECAHDVIAPPEVGAYVHAAIPGSRLVTLDATGHCPQLSAPEATAEAIASFVAGLGDVPDRADAVEEPERRLPGRAVLARCWRTAPRTCTRTRRAATCPRCWTARSPRSTRRCWAGSATPATRSWAVRRFADLLTVGGRLYHETHFAPLLRMQGEISGVALELRTADGSRLPVLVTSTRQDRRATASRC